MDGVRLRHYTPTASLPWLIQGSWYGPPEFVWAIKVVRRIMELVKIYFYLACMTVVLVGQVQVDWLKQHIYWRMVLLPFARLRTGRADEPPALFCAGVCKSSGASVVSNDYRVIDSRINCHLAPVVVKRLDCIRFYRLRTVYIYTCEAIGCRRRVWYLLFGEFPLFGIFKHYKHSFDLLSIPCQIPHDIMSLAKHLFFFPAFWAFLVSKRRSASIGTWNNII